MKNKKCVVTMFLFLCSIVCSRLDAKALHAHHKLNKIYVDAQSVKVDKGCIVIHTRQGPFKVKTLRSDARGVFVFEKELFRLKKSDMLLSILPQNGLGAGTKR